MAQLYPFTDPVDVAANPPTTMVAGDASTVIDDTGRRYLDVAAGLWSAALGFSEQRLIDAATRQMEALPWYHNFMGRCAEPADRLAAALAAKLPTGLDHVFFACTGSEAVDTAVKLARYYQQARGMPDKKAVIAREDGYHGSGTMSAALSWFDYMHEGFELPLDAVHRIGSMHHRVHARDGESEAEFSQRRAAELDALITSVGADTVCAMIGEPVVGSGGAIVPPAGYWPAIQEVLDHHDVLLIADEIITGFGRTGRWFASERYGIRPSLLTMAKQLSASYFPISAVAVHDDVHQVLSELAHKIGTLGHGFTYGGHPVGAAVALEAIAIYEDLDLERHVAGRGRLLARLLEPVAAQPEVCEVRQVGLLAGVELERRGEVGAAGSAVGRAAERAGVLFRVIGDTLAISPPLIIEEAELEHAIEVLRASIAEVFGQG